MAAPTAVAALVDRREPVWVRELRFGGAPVAVRFLDAGDVHALTSDGCVLMIERKTPADLIHSIVDGRLFPQVARLRDRTPHGYLVVDGLVSCGRSGQVIHAGRDTGFAWAALQGALLTVQELGVAVQEFPEGQFEDAVLGLIKRHRGDVHPARRVLAAGDPALAVLTSLPGIGLERAFALLKTCGTAAYALWALTETHPRTWTNTAEGSTAIGGIGPATKAAVRAALGLEDGRCLVPVAEESPNVEARPWQRITATIGADPAREETN